MQGLQTRAAINDDAQILADLRVAAMRPSLEALGRFDPQRAKDRFLRAFVPQDTTIIYLDGTIAGFYVLRRLPDHLHLDHLYIAPRFQGRGIGRDVILIAQQEAQDSLLPIRLVALNQSPSNQFYQRHGFVAVSSDDLDTVYQWRPGKDNAA